jgi:glycosyltransferase involved in cell wall biosynthesis
MEKQKKLIVGITAPGSVGLLPGQLAYFKSKGYRTYLLSPRSERSESYCEREGCELLEVNMRREISPFLDIMALFKIIIIFQKIKPDIINFGTPKVSLLGMIAARIIGVKHRIYTCRGLRYEHESGVLKKILMLMEKITSYCAHDIICISNSVMELGVRDNIFSLEKASVIHKGSSNGINLRQFDASFIELSAKKKLKEMLRLHDYFVFGFLGRIIDRKGIHELYLAFDQLYQKNKNVRLLIVGPAEEGQIKNPEILELLKKHEGVIWPGRTDEVPLHLSIMNVFVLPAWWEGFGNVLVQAAAMGVPVISTSGTGTIDAVNDGFNGILVPIKDVNSLSTAMETLLLNDDLRKQYGANGIEFAKNFDNKIIWEGLDELYRK